MLTYIMGKSQATVSQIQSYIQKVNPAVPQFVLAMIPYYISEGEIEGVRGDIAFCQSCLETGNFTFQGSAVTPEQNNFAGIGVTKNGEKGHSWPTAQQGIRAQIQDLKAYASDDPLLHTCIDPRFSYVRRNCAPYVKWLGMQENPDGYGWAAGAGYGAKILRILDALIKTKEKEENKTVRIDTTYRSTKNSYAGNTPNYIVIHNTDNYSAGADAKAHAKAQYNGNFSGYSAHCYVDDTNTAYEALPADRGAWHVGVNYGGRLFGTVSNRNSYGIEMCVQAGYDYEKSFQNTVAVCRMKMEELGIDAAHVVQHFDVCTKNCPSAIRAKGDWERFKKLIGGSETDQTLSRNYLQKGDTGEDVREMQRMLIEAGFTCGEAGADGIFGTDTRNAVIAFQSRYNLLADGLYGEKSREKLEEILNAPVKYVVQAGVFSDKANAQELVKSLKKMGFDAIVKVV